MMMTFGTRSRTWIMAVLGFFLITSHVGKAMTSCPEQPYLESKGERVDKETVFAGLEGFDNNMSIDKLSNEQRQKLASEGYEIKEKPIQNIIFYFHWSLVVLLLVAIIFLIISQAGLKLDFRDFGSFMIWVIILAVLFIITAICLTFLCKENRLTENPIHIRHGHDGYTGQWISSTVLLGAAATTVVVGCAHAHGSVLNEHTDLVEQGNNAAVEEIKLINTATLDTTRLEETLAAMEAIDEADKAVFNKDKQNLTEISDIVAVRTKLTNLLNLEDEDYGNHFEETGETFDTSDLDAYLGLHYAALVTSCVLLAAVLFYSCFMCFRRYWCKPTAKASTINE